MPAVLPHRVSFVSRLGILVLSWGAVTHCVKLASLRPYTTALGFECASRHREMPLWPRVLRGQGMGLSTSGVMLACAVTRRIVRLYLFVHNQPLKLYHHIATLLAQKGCHDGYTFDTVRHGEPSGVMVTQVIR